MASLSVHKETLARKLASRLRSFSGDAPIAILIETTAETLPPERFYEDMCIELIRANWTLTTCHRCAALPSLSPGRTCLLTSQALHCCGTASVEMDRALLSPPNARDGRARPSRRSRHRWTRARGDCLRPNPWSGSGKNRRPYVATEQSGDTQMPTVTAAFASAIAKELPLEFDHFEIQRPSADEPGMHFPCVLNARNLADNDEILAQLRQVVGDLCASGRPLFASMEIEGSRGIAEQEARSASYGWGS